MKFLVIGKNHGNDHGLSASAGSAREHASNIRSLLSDGTVEAAYAILSGGHAYVVNAESTQELAYIVRGNPLFSSSDTEIIPIADADDFLEGVANHLS